MLPSQRDLFFYNGDDTFEDLANYKPNGLHPVLLGDILPMVGTCISDNTKQPRYRIAQKLGHGAFSTVWLARDLLEERYVAVKVCCGFDNPTKTNEEKILSQIHQTGRGKPGYENIIEMYDFFTIKGPNGFHECLVTEVVLPLTQISIERVCPAEKVIQQILTGFTFLHKEGLVHGDPHLANFGIAIPKLQQLKESDIADYFADPVLCPVVPRDSSFSGNSVPSYIVEDVSLVSLVERRNCLPSKDEIRLKILDFGRAFWSDKEIQALPGAAPISIQPPEVYMYSLTNGKVGSIWSKEADIWAIGATIYEIKIAFPLFSAQGNDGYKIYQALQLGAPAPKKWLEYWDLQKFCDSTKQWKEPISPTFDTEKAWESFRPQRDPRGHVFIDFVRKLVIAEPEKRSQLDQLFSHFFLLEN